MALSQDNRLIRIATPLGEGTLVVLSFSGVEYVSREFSFSMELASEKNDITFEQLAGQNVTVGLRSSDGTERYINGIIMEFAAMETAVKDGLSKYHAVLVPAVRLLRGCVDCRIFQDKSTPDIIKEVLGAGSLKAKGVAPAIDYRLNLSGAYPAKEYCVQYNESDFDFINRLCEHEGIFYYFEHENKKHTLVFADKADKHKPYTGGASRQVRFQGAVGGHLEKEVITSMQSVNRMIGNRYMARDYNFTVPNNDMTVKRSTQVTDPKGQGEIYEYPGGYAITGGEGNTLAKMRMEAEDVQSMTIQGRGSCRKFAPGYKFLLADYPIRAMNGKEYVLTRVRHEAKQDFSTGATEGDSYFNMFACIPHKVPFRAQRKVRKPVIAGSQTAIVTGPKAEEIHTDEHGRVKVKFHWDRRTDKKMDGNMSCWMRVSQNWAGAKWGTMNIPRVGQEVIVNFLDGDPDRPIITGRVYHGLNKPPYDLPADKTKSTIKSSSTKNGEGNFNELRFEDLKGSEEFYTHAAKDQNEVVENDISTEVKRHQTINVEKNRSLTVASGNEKIAVSKGSRDVTVKSNEKHVNSANFDHTVSGNYTLKVNGNITIDASGLVTISGAKIILNG
jgi:type VI secretion system secreted protein VgrG